MNEVELNSLVSDLFENCRLCHLGSHLCDMSGIFPFCLLIISIFIIPIASYHLKSKCWLKYLPVTVISCADLRTSICVKVLL